jgi:hypothetical protein
MLKQIGMSACAIKNYPAGFFINAVYEEPVRFNVTFSFPFIFSMQGMIFVFWEQGLFVNKYTHNIPQLMDVFAAFLYQLAIFIKRTGYLIIEHDLQSQQFVQVFKRIMPCSGNFSSEHSVSFFKSRESLGIVARVSRHGIAVRGADGTFAIREKPFFGVCSLLRACLGRKGKNNRPGGYFAGHGNGQPVAGGNFYGLRYGHKETIA